ncbi:MAG TPA: hypothetical protein PKA61_07510 [Nitrospira sp.]|nr:hypothetical protein [Nitrospira sp.]
MENETDNSERKRRPGYLTAYANHARITKTAAADQLKRVGIDYFKPFEFAEADRLRAAARHADRAKFAKPIYVDPGVDPLGEDAGDDDHEASEDPALAQSQRKKEEFRAKLVELEYEERVGTLVRKDEVEKEMFQIGRLVRDAVLNVPSRLAGIIAAESDQRKVHDLLERELRQALEALSIHDQAGPEAA